MSIFLSTLKAERKKNKSEEKSRPPVWLMRQAGRSLRSYQDLKKKYTFKKLLKTPKLACEVTELPIKDLGVDAAVLFSDILVVLEALGVSINYDGRLKKSEKKKPFIEKPLTLQNLKILKKNNPKKSLTTILFPTIKLSSLEHNYEAIRLYKTKNDLPLIGFCASPFTVFLYLFEKKSNDHLAGPFEEALTCFYQHPDLADSLLNLLCEVSVAYGIKQIKSGVDAFKIFDTWANLIPFADYKKRIEPLIYKMVNDFKNYKANLPLIFFPRFFSPGYEHLSPNILNNINALSIDYSASLPLLHHGFSKSNFKDLVLQGNFHPFLVQNSSPEQLKKILFSYLKEHKELVKKNKWMFNLGHGVLPATPEENLKILVREVKNFPYSL